MNRGLVLAISIALGAMFIQAHAQYPYPGYPTYPGYGYPGTGASTVGQSYAMGMADLVQAAGQANLSNSEASKNYEQAASMNLDNQLKGTNTYFEMRKMNTAYRKAEDSRFKGLSTEDSWRVAQESTPKRLRSTELDPVTGKIYWPMLFTDPRYQSYRQQLDQLFVQRESAHGGIGYDNYMQIKQVTSALLADLKKNIDKYQPGEYLMMRGFVESLAYESSLPAV
jgi:hypothetical protein